MEVSGVRNSCETMAMAGLQRGKPFLQFACSLVESRRDLANLIPRRLRDACSQIACCNVVRKFDDAAKAAGNVLCRDACNQQSYNKGHRRSKQKGATHTLCTGFHIRKRIGPADSASGHGGSYIKKRATKPTAAAFLP